MVRQLVVILIVAMVGFGSAPVAIDLVSTDVLAQSVKVAREKPSFLKRLFGTRKGDRKRVKKSKKRRSTKKSRKPAVVTVEVQPKDPDASKVLVVGDFIAGGLAWGLEQALADEPKLAVIDKSNANSGLVRDDYFDWNASLLEFLNELQPDVIVLALGANDRQDMRDGTARSEIRSAPWVAAYTERIDGLVETLKLYGRPFFWVGVPPMRATVASADMAYLNGLFKPRASVSGGNFVDIWNGFANEDGRFVSSGPDVAGQVHQLRTRDGVGFTRAGRLKLAFYVERAIRRQTGFGSGGIDLLATVTHENQIEIGPDGTMRLVGPIISLSNPQPGSSRDLADSTTASLPTPESLQFKAIVLGEALPTVAGRVDDFSWPPRKAAISLPIASLQTRGNAIIVPTPVARPDIGAN